MANPFQSNALKKHLSESDNRSNSSTDGRGSRSLRPDIIAKGADETRRREGSSSTDTPQAQFQEAISKVAAKAFPGTLMQKAQSSDGQDPLLKNVEVDKEGNVSIRRYRGGADSGEAERQWAELGVPLREKYTPEEMDQIKEQFQRGIDSLISKRPNDSQVREAKNDGNWLIVRIEAHARDLGEIHAQKAQSKEDDKLMAQVYGVSLDEYCATYKATQTNQPRVDDSQPKIDDSKERGLSIKLNARFREFRELVKEISEEVKGL